MKHTAHPVEQEEVMAYLDGELAAERAAAVAAHIEQCAECTALAGDLLGVSRQMSAWQVEASPASLGARVQEAIAQHRQQKPPAGKTQPWLSEVGRRSWLLPRWAWQAAAVVGVFLLVAAISIPNLYRARMVAPETLNAIGLEGRPADAASSDGKTVGRYRGTVALRDGTAAQVAGPMIVRTASLTIVPKDFATARAAVEKIVREHGGYLGELTTSNPRGAAQTLTATLRIPSPQLDAALAELKKLGRVEQESQSGEEVTQQYVDLVARLANARATEKRLIEVLQQRTGKVGDVLEVEREIARVREEIERMDAQRKGLEKQVQFATVRLELREDYQAQIEVTPPSTGSRLWNALADGYHSAVESALGLVLFLLSAGPTLLLWAAILFWPARVAWHKFRAPWLPGRNRRLCKSGTAHSSQRT